MQKEKQELSRDRVYVCVFGSLYLLLLFWCVCVRAEQMLAATRIYTREKARGRLVGARRRRAPRQDKAGGVARRLTIPFRTILRKKRTLDHI